MVNKYLSELLLRSTPEAIRERIKIRSPIKYLSSMYGLGNPLEWMKGTWELEFDITRLEDTPGFKGWDQGGWFRPIVDDSPRIKTGRIVVARSFKGKLYARSLTSQELKELSYRKIATVYTCKGNPERKYDIPDDKKFIDALPYRVLTAGFDEFNNPMNYYSSIWQLDK